MKLIGKSKISTIIKGTVLILLVSLFLAYIKSLIPFEITNTAAEINEGIRDNYLLIILPLLISPVVEELVFRKWIPAAFEDVLGRGKVIVFSNVLFTLFHFDPFFLPYLVNGLIYSWYYEKTGDIKIPTMIHIFYNVLVFLITNINFA